MRRGPDIGLTHEEAMLRHALRALWERQGVAISRAEYMDLCVAIFLNRHPIALRDDRGQPAYRLRVHDVETFAVWSVPLARIVTFLPSREWVGRRWNGRGFVSRQIEVAP